MRDPKFQRTVVNSPVVIGGEVKVTDISTQRPYVFVHGSDGNLWVDWWNGSVWTWTNLAKPPGVDLNESMSVVTVRDPKFQRTGVGRNGEVQVSDISTQRPYVFAHGSDGNLWVDWWNDSAWTWTNLGKPPGVDIHDAVSVVTVRDPKFQRRMYDLQVSDISSQRPYVFAHGSDGNLWVDWWNDSAWTWTNLGKPPGVDIHDAVSVVTVMAASTSDQRPYVFVHGSDGNLWVDWWNGSVWNWTNLGKPPDVDIHDAVSVLTMMDTPASDQRPYAFVHGNDGNLWVAWET